MLGASYYFTMSAEQEIKPFFEIEIKDGADLDYFMWKAIQAKIRDLQMKCPKGTKITNERTPPFNYLMKVRFTLESGDYTTFLELRKLARQQFADKDYHGSLTQAEETRRRLER